MNMFVFFAFFWGCFGRARLDHQSRCVIGGMLPRRHLRDHTCHILPPTEFDWGLLSAFSQVRKGSVYFTESAERVEYGKYEIGRRVVLGSPTESHRGGRCRSGPGPRCLREVE